MKKQGRDLRLLALALFLLAIPLASYFWNSRVVQQRRQATLAGVPQFPAPNQAPRRKPFPVSAPVAAKEMRPPPPLQPAATKQDPMTSFVMAPGPGAVLIQVNALFNTPLFDRLRQCLPEYFRSLDEAGRKLGVDLAYDVDRVGFLGDGVAMSGFFAGKPVAESMIGAVEGREEYRGSTIFSRTGRCVAQLGNLVVMPSQSGVDCRALIDRALAATPANAGDELYGDVFMRSDLARFRNAEAPAEIRAMMDGVDRITLRANVWDSVALTVEAVPREGRNPVDLAQMALGAVALVKGQLDEDQVELRTLADLAKVSTESGKLELNLALPAQDLFDRFHFPCEGRDGGNQPR
jgi:hypothetical protein